MSGETEQHVSGWTVDTLHVHLTTMIVAKDKRDDQRFEAQQVALRDALDAQEKAVAKAEMAAEKRFDSVNEFRASLADQAANLMPRSEAMVLISGLKEQVDRNRVLSDERFAQVTGDSRFVTGKTVGTENLTKLVFAAIAAAGVIFGIVSNLH